MNVHLHVKFDWYEKCVGYKNCDDQIKINRDWWFALRQQQQVTEWIMKFIAN